MTLKRASGRKRRHNSPSRRSSPRWQSGAGSEKSRPGVLRTQETGPVAGRKFGPWIPKSMDARPRQPSKLPSLDAAASLPLAERMRKLFAGNDPCGCVPSCDVAVVAVFMPQVAPVMLPRTRGRERRSRTFGERWLADRTARDSPTRSRQSLFTFAPAQPTVRNPARRPATRRLQPRGQPGRPGRRRARRVAAFEDERDRRRRPADAAARREGSVAELLRPRRRDRGPELFCRREPDAAAPGSAGRQLGRNRPDDPRVSKSHCGPSVL